MARHCLIQTEKVAPDKPMSLSTFNGDIDVTLLAAIKTTATLKMESQQCSIDSDFDLDKNPRQPKVGNGLWFGAGMGYAFYALQKPGLKGSGEEAIGLAG